MRKGSRERIHRRPKRGQSGCLLFLTGRVDGEFFALHRMREASMSRGMAGLCRCTMPVFFIKSAVMMMTSGSHSQMQGRP
jgi:hypothetical protein